MFAPDVCGAAVRLAAAADGFVCRYEKTTAAAAGAALLLLGRDTV